MMELGVLGTAGMWESRAGVRIVFRRLHVGFRAFDGPPARGIFLRIAQLHAAASPVRFGAVAEAATRWNGAQQGWRVREKRKCAG